MASIAAGLPGEYQHRAAWKAGVMGALNLVAVILAVRLILLLAVVGAFVLTWTVLKSADPVAWPALVVLVGYGALVVIPIVWLSSRR